MRRTACGVGEFIVMGIGFQGKHGLILRAIQTLKSGRWTPWVDQTRGLGEELVPPGSGSPSRPAGIYINVYHMHNFL